MKWVMTAVLVIATLGSGTANAAKRTISLSNVGIMVSPEGAARFLVGPAAEIDMTNLSIDHAVIEVPLPTGELIADMRVAAWAVDGPWSPGIVPWDFWTSPGGDVRSSTRGRSDVRAGAIGATLAIVVTGSMRAVASGSPFYGFLLTVPSAYGVGFNVADAARLQAALSGATMTITYSHAPPERRASGS